VNLAAEVQRVEQSAVLVGTIESIDGEIVILRMGGSLLLVELPAYFALGATRARAIGLAVPAAIIVAVVLAGWAFPDAGTTLLGWLEGTSLAWLALAAVAILAVLGTVSNVLAARLYAGRDL